MLSLGRFFGVPIYFAPSWLVISALLTISYGPFVKDSVPGISASSAYLLAFGYTVVFALCVLAHELGHTAVSLLLRHPVRRVVIFLLGGVSEIEREPDRPRDEFLIALAGPLVRFYDFEQIDEAMHDAETGAAIKPVLKMQTA